MRDSAYAVNIPTSWTGVVAGYLEGGDPFRPWSLADWQRFRGHKKLPIFVQSAPVAASAVKDAFTCLHSLYVAGARSGCLVALDLEGAINPDYVTRFGKVLHWAGHRVWPYGQKSTIFSNPPLDGRWVAWYRDIGPFMIDDPTVRATQYADPVYGSGGRWDSSTVRWWQLHNAPWWV